MLVLHRLLLSPSVNRRDSHNRYTSTTFWSRCACAKTCGKDPRLGANHYWDTPDTNTPRLDDMMKRYERHMLFYQLLERSCDLDFRIARKDHCDAT